MTAPAAYRRCAGTIGLGLRIVNGAQVVVRHSPLRSAGLIAYDRDEYRVAFGLLGLTCQGAQTGQPDGIPVATSWSLRQDLLGPGPLAVGFASRGGDDDDDGGGAVGNWDVSSKKGTEWEAGRGSGGEGRGSQAEG